MSPPNRLAFCGVSGTGKTTLAKLLVTTQNYKRFSFAHDIKTGLGRMLMLQLYGQEIMDPVAYVEQNKDVLRPVLQELGHQARQLNSRIWIDSVEKRINEHGDYNLVIDDVRYQNEIEMLREHGFMIIRITQPFNLLTTKYSNHTSEQLNRLYYDRTIDNDLPLEPYQQLLALIDEYV